MWEDFKSFAMQGNVLDLAVGVIIGAAFGQIVSSLVENLFTPLLGILLGGISFKGLALQVGDETLAYGLFLQSVFDFLIVAFALFIFVRMIGKLRREKPEANAVEEPPAPTQEELLSEIRDLLKERTQVPLE